MSHRVVITGCAGVCPLGDSWEQARASLAAMKNRVRHVEALDSYDGLNTKLASLVSDFALPERYADEREASMGRVAQMAVHATGLALEQAGLIGDPVLTGGATGVAFGSCTGSTAKVLELVAAIRGEVASDAAEPLTRTDYVRALSHTAAINIARTFGLTGRLVPTPSACTAGSQSIGYACEALRAGRQTVMIAGGGEEFCASEAATFDVLYATSTVNDAPHTTPRPFDRDRDGLVIGEGAGTVVLENRDHALARGATPLAEVVGFGTNADGAHVTRPNETTMGRALEMALADAGIDGREIGYVNAHGTATEHGDIAETRATARVLGHAAPISSLKSYIGHTLGACGALEAWLLVNMLRNNWYAPTINLENVDERCGDLDYVREAPRELDNEFVMSNNFAFGGINTSLVLRNA
ncbi:MAG: beta-ketoacyl-ACP synthase [Pseudomonadota bacterium]